MLITTRDKRMSERQAGRDTSVIIPRMTLSETQELLRSQFESANCRNNKDSRTLPDALEYIPLTVTQAATFLSQNNCSLTEYLPTRNLSVPPLVAPLLPHPPPLFLLTLLISSTSNLPNIHLKPLPKKTCSPIFREPGQSFCREGFGCSIIQRKLWADFWILDFNFKPHLLQFPSLFEKALLLDQYSPLPSPFVPLLPLISHQFLCFRNLPQFLPTGPKHPAIQLIRITTPPGP